MTIHPFIEQRAFRGAAVIGALEHVCRALEPSQTQIQEARSRYEAVGHWLTGSSDLGLQQLSIYLQGSTALGTVVRPLLDIEFDVDLVSNVGGRENRGPAAIKKLIGDRLKENERYRSILVEKPRCWRLDYANEFHRHHTVHSQPSLSEWRRIGSRQEARVLEGDQPEGLQGTIRASSFPDANFPADETRSGPSRSGY